MSAFDAYIRLDGSLDGSISCDVPMARHTTYRIGGPADLMVNCASLSDLSLTLETLAEEEVPWTIVGKGSNLLVSDEGYRGAVITLDGQFARTDFGGYEKENPDGLQDVFITAGSGVVLSTLVQKAFGLSLSGFEFAIGTPGTLGGTLFMNAGTRDKGIGDIVESVTTYEPGRGLRIRHHDELPWDYRSSGIPAGEVIVEARLHLKPADSMMLHAAMEAGLKRRKASQPFGMASCGSVFRNPAGDSAGRLIQECGLQGRTQGGAQISEVHANFIVNTGGASAQDVMTLIKLARDTVKEVHDVELVPEVKFLGF